MQIPTINSYEDFIHAIQGDVPNSEKILNLIKARGFTINQNNCIVDQAYQAFCKEAVNDINYLKQLLYSYGSLSPIENRIVFDNYENLNQFTNLIFPEITPSTLGEEMCMISHGWNFVQSVLRSDPYDMYIPVSKLEPYLARFVKALNVCGLKTISMCDGNHCRNNDRSAAYIIFDGRPFALIFELLWDNYLRHHVSRSHIYRIQWAEFEFATSPIRKWQSYYELNRLSDYLLTHSEQIKSIILNTLEEMQLTHISDLSDIDNTFTHIKPSLEKQFDILFL